MAGRQTLVTGGAGLIGSHLVRHRLAAGDSVLVLDDFSTGHADSLADLAGHPGLRIIRQDVRQPLEPAPTLSRIWHLACPASPLHYSRDPVRTLTTAVNGTLAMLDLARATGARVLIASTSEVYGDPAVHPQPEGYWGHVNPRGPRSCYDEGKRAAEALAHDHGRHLGTDVRVARIFNTYGPGMRADDGRVIPGFITRALSGGALEVHGDGHQTRSFCHVDDMVDGLCRLMEAQVQEPVNLGNPEEISMLALARRVVQLAGSASPIRHLPAQPDDPARRCPDIGRARAMLGWAPTVGLDAGLAGTIAWFRQHSVRALVS
jgi:UDP-glucuronate decarboxylase